ncbi:MAG TPA: sialidase family protein, partial [Kofleriaceae bacterium]|nr:sialidase family protein [Kofleriaceae bacterium]
MPRRLVRPSSLVGVLIALGALGALPGLARTASANGRLPATVSITFREGHPDDIVAGLTFGLAISHDGGATWSWMCDDAIGIAGGPYDPIYSYSPAGTLFATTLSGLVVMRDGCAFNPPGTGFVSATTLGPDGTFYYGASVAGGAAMPSDFKIYHSADDGMNFPTPTQPDPITDTNVWWESITVAPSNKQIVYLSGFRYIPVSAGSTEMKRDHLLYRSDDGGASWKDLSPVQGFPPFMQSSPLMQNSLIHIVAVASDTPSHLYARVAYIDNMTTDGLYVSTDSGVTWTLMLSQPDRFLTFVARAAKNPSTEQHDLLTATAKFGTQISHDDGKTWQPLAGAPHINCLSENAAGELWACTQNYGVGQTQSDDAGIMKTTDLSAWTKVLRYQDLLGPVAACGGDTTQQKTCNQSTLWCGVCAQLGCTPAASYACPSAASEAPVTPPPMSKGGCCDTGSSGGGPLALALSVATLLLRPRRRP